MPATRPAPGAILGDRYRLLEQLGAGGMGVVFRAERLGIGKIVAIKFLQTQNPELARRFKREIAASSRLAHPHLVEIVDSGTYEGAPYMVMEYAPGRPLTKLLEKGAVDPSRAVGIARQILAGIDHAHTGGVVHRDLKPDNVVLLDAPREGGADVVKVLDFGLAKIVRGEGEGVQLTGEGIALGTPSYLAPEQARGGDVDRRADVYAIGVILYHMVTGRRPFIGEDVIAVVKKQIAEPPVPPRTLRGPGVCSPELEAAILRAMEKQPARRFQTARDFAAALEATPEGRASVVPEIATPAEVRSVHLGVAQAQAAGEPAEIAPAPRPSGGRRAALVVTGVLVALATAALVWVLRAGG